MIGFDRLQPSSPRPLFHAPHIAHIGALASFDCHPELLENVAQYRRSRAHLLRALPAAGFTRLSPAEGAFYLFANVSDRTNGSVAYCARLRAEAGIAASPGLDFDHAHGSSPAVLPACRPAARRAKACLASYPIAPPIPSLRATDRVPPNACHQAPRMSQSS